MTKPILGNRTARRVIGMVAVNGTGAGITGVALPVLGISFALSDSWIAVIEAASFVAGALLVLGVGVVVDRATRLHTLVVGCLIGILSLAVGIVAVLTDFVSGPLLLAVSVALVLAYQLTDLSLEAAIPDLFPGSQLIRVNGAVRSAEETANIVGPGAGGLLLSALGYLWALVVDLLSFVYAAIVALKLTELRNAPASGASTEPGPRNGRVRRIVKTLRGGWSPYRQDGFLARILVFGAVSNFFSTMASTVEILYLVRELKVPGWGVGLAFAVSSVGGVLGGLIVGRLAARVGDLRLCMLSPLVVGIPVLLIAVTQTPWSFAFYLIGWFFYSLSSVTYAVPAVSYRQTTVPREQLGRAVSVDRFIGTTSAALGAILVAAVIGSVGIRVLVVISAVGIYLAGFIMLSRRRPDDISEAGSPTVDEIEITP